MEFVYVASDINGAKHKGKLDVAKEKDVVDYLRSKNLIPLQIKSAKAAESSIIRYLNRVKESDTILFTRQLSTMIVTGLTLVESLTILKQQTSKQQMHKVINDLIATVSEGGSFSEALSNHKEVFSQVYIALVTAAEEGGILDKVLLRLADNLERSADTKKRVKSALFYPGIIISGVIIVIVMMNIFVIPQLGELYDSLDIELPLTTKLVLGFSELTSTFLPFIIILLIAAFFGLRKYKKTPSGIRLIDKLKLKLPVFGKIFELSSLAEVTRTLSLLVGSGSSLIKALGISADVSGNVIYKTALLSTSALVEKGVGLSVALQNQNIFPPVMIQMVKVGEATGKIDESLLKVAQYFERDLDLRVKTLTTAIEPILIIVLGVSVAFLIISVITPIYGLISQIQ